MTTTEPDAPTTADPVPPAPVEIDLDAIRAAHAAEANVGPIVRYKGVEYQLPPRLPLGVLRHIGGLMRGAFFALEETLKILFPAAPEAPDADPDAPKPPSVVDDLFATLDVDDVQVFMDQVGKAYGIVLGNSAASSES